jgi:omega-6 fatty acid desaturase (delta-12 desaturase)
MDTTNKINETELFTKYKSSYATPLFVTFATLTQLGVANYLVYLTRESYSSYLFIPILALLNLKTFMIFHDCAHNSFTPNKTLNYVIGSVAGILTTSASMNWILDHHIHHQTNGNVTNKFNYAYNETTRITYREYANLSKIGRSIAKFLLYPIVQFPLMAFLYFCVIQRFIYIVKKFKYKSKIQDTMFMICVNHIINNLGTGAMVYFIYQCGYLHIHLIQVLVGQTIGYTMFFNQHTFNMPYIANNEDWNQRNSGLHGSSLIMIPDCLKYFSFGIEYHHIHHINAKIPGYNLQKYHDEVVQNSDMFDGIVKLSIGDCYNNLWLAMYDEDDKRFLTIEEADKKMEENKSR